VLRVGGVRHASAFVVARGRWYAPGPVGADTHDFPVDWDVGRGLGLLETRQLSQDRFEVDGLRLLAAGRPGALLEVVEAGDRQDLVADLLRADAGVRQGHADVTDLQELVERVHREVPLRPPASSGADPWRLRAWAHAILAEQLFADRLPAALPVAKAALDELDALPSPVVPSVAMRYARARLFRLVGGGWLLVPSAQSLAHYMAMRDDAITDLLACGFTAEVHATRGISAGLISMILCEDIPEYHHLLTDARAALGDSHGSMWPAILDFFLANTCFEVGDIKGALRAFDRLEHSSYRHPFLMVLPGYGRAFFRLVTAGASPATIEGIDRALADVRRNDPQVAQFWYWHVAHTLADLGNKTAGRFVRLEAELPVLAIRGADDRRLLELRLLALEGEPVSTTEVFGHLESLLGAGQGRRAARTAARLGHDLAGGGDPDGARIVHGWGVDHLPSPARRTPWEDWWCRPIDAPATAPRILTQSASLSVRSRAVAPPVRLRVLAPAVEVEAGGHRVPLSDSQSKLVLALVLAHPSPLHIEQASDTLWPDEPLAATRPRLSSLVHRVRRALHPHGDAVVRSGDLLRLAPTRCHVDLWAFQQGLIGDDDQRKAALLSLQGNLADAQFPYDEVFIEARHRLVAEWLGHAGRARRAGEIDAKDVEPVLTSLRLSPGDLEQASTRPV
jgi:hypothetical protein